MEGGENRYESERENGREGIGGDCRGKRAEYNVQTLCEAVVGKVVLIGLMVVGVDGGTISVIGRTHISGMGLG